MGITSVSGISVSVRVDGDNAAKRKAIHSAPSFETV